jgi:hypothetical protein
MTIRKIQLVEFIQLARKQIEDRASEDMKDLGTRANLTLQQLQIVEYTKRIVDMFQGSTEIEIPMDHFHDIVDDILNNEYTLEWMDAGDEAI